ncbi:MAG: transketolase C-terminal domain-containing protein, partial [Armatimonadota bacterium]
GDQYAHEHGHGHTYSDEYAYVHINTNGDTHSGFHTDSHEHTEEGHITEELPVRPPMVRKRLRKGDGIRAETIPPEYHGDDGPDILMVCWGSTRGSTLEAAASLRAEGKSVGVLHFSQVWPLVPEQFVDRLQSAREVICVEGNATGQFARLIRRETGFVAHRLLLRYDGLPHTPEYILRELKRP